MNVCEKNVQQSGLTYLWIQWALDTTQYLFISTPPHQWPIKPSDGWSSSRDACQPNSPSRVGKPCMILGCLDCCGYVEFLRWCWYLLDFNLAANATKKDMQINKWIKINCLAKRKRKRKENFMLIVYVHFMA